MQSIVHDLQNDELVARAVTAYQHAGCPAWCPSGTRLPAGVRAMGRSHHKEAGWESDGLTVSPPRCQLAQVVLSFAPTQGGWGLECFCHRARAVARGCSVLRATNANAANPQRCKSEL